MTPDCAVDLSDDNSFAHGFPHDYFKWLRAHAPVFWHAPTDITPDNEGFWVVSRYADVMHVLRTPTIFSSDTGGDRIGGGTTMKDERAAGKILNYTDDPKHRVLRSLVNKGFTAQAVGKLEAELRRRANLLIDDFPDNQIFDFVSAYAQEIPLQAICIVLGVPQSDRGMLCEWVDKGLEGASENVLSKEYYLKIIAYAKDIIAAKRANPEEDILSDIVQARLPEYDDRGLTDEELVNFFSLLFPAGSETTRSAMGGGLRALLDNPEQMQKFRQEPGLARSAVEEVVRFTTPSIYKRRTVREDTVLSGQQLKRGDKVTIWEMSANYDERVFDDPYRFDISRNPNRHLGFGFGAHICLGAGLARMEIKLGLEELIARTKDIRLAGPPEWIPNNRLLGLKRMAIDVTLN